MRVRGHRKYPGQEQKAIESECYHVLIAPKSGPAYIIPIWMADLHTRSYTFQLWKQNFHMRFIYSLIFYLYHLAYIFFFFFALCQETIIVTGTSAQRCQGNSEETFETRCKNFVLKYNKMFNAQIWQPKALSLVGMKKCLSVLYFQRNQIRHGP